MNSVIVFLLMCRIMKSIMMFILVRRITSIDDQVTKQHMSKMTAVYRDDGY